jgi:hypothetical protein
MEERDLGDLAMQRLAFLGPKLPHAQSLCEPIPSSRS